MTPPLCGFGLKLMFEKTLRMLSVLSEIVAQTVGICNQFHSKCFHKVFAKFKFFQLYNF